MITTQEVTQIQREIPFVTNDSGQLHFLYTLEFVGLLNVCFQSQQHEPSNTAINESFRSGMPKVAKEYALACVYLSRNLTKDQKTACPSSTVIAKSYKVSFEYF